MFKIVSDGSAYTSLPSISGRMATAGESVIDGDTIQTAKEGLIDIRFCGVDAAERGITLDKKEYNFIFNVQGDAQNKTQDLTYVQTSDLSEYFSNPFDTQKYSDTNDFIEALGEEIVNNYLKRILNERTAKNHAYHADRARTELMNLVENDIRRSIKASDRFQLYVEFPFEVIDAYGRFLGWVYYEKDKPFMKNSKKIRPALSYNEKLLRMGYAIPYFIWPNVSPLGETNMNLSVMQSLPYAKDFKKCIEADTILNETRNYVRKARESKLGIFEEGNELMLLPFEFRYLLDRYTGKGPTSKPITCDNNNPDDANSGKASKKPIHRYVLNLNNLDVPTLEPPEYYYKIPLEDRLFVDEQYVPLFSAKGYRVEGEEWFKSN
jgi:endonuclease YncB( thermonuclease family)